MSSPAEAARLDDIAALTRDDPSSMLRLVAGSGAQVREAAVAAAEAGLSRLSAEGRPRAVVVAGAGTAGLCGDMLAAVAGTACAVPVVVHRGYDLPLWVGAADAVIGVSCSGSSEEALSAVEQAAHRGCVVVGVGAADSPLADIVGRSRGVHLPVPAGRVSRASLWAQSVPVLLAGAALDILTLGEADLAATADRLDDLAERCRPASESFLNPAKQLAGELAGSLPMVWGSSPLAAVAAYRFTCQLADNAKSPAIAGALPEAGYHQVMVFDGPVGGRSAVVAEGPADFFRDRAGDVESARLRLVLLRDSGEHPRVARRCAVARELADSRGLEVNEVLAEGESALERLASLICLPDFASVYLALLNGTDPTPSWLVDELESRILT